MREEINPNLLDQPFPHLSIGPHTPFAPFDVGKHILQLHVDPVVEVTKPKEVVKLVADVKAVQALLADLQLGHNVTCVGIALQLPFNVGGEVAIDEAERRLGKVKSHGDAALIAERVSQARGHGAMLDVANLVLQFVAHKDDEADLQQLGKGDLVKVEAQVVLDG
jgi:hypothetical protein